jgi:translation initiation factor IF-2
MQLLRRAPWRSLALGLVASGVALGGLFYTTAHGLMAPLAQQAAATATPTAAATPTGPGAPAAGPATGAGPGKPKPLRPGVSIGTVTAVAHNPDSFTVHSIQDSSDTTYRVLDQTVFYAPPDRPYNFGLLKVGDEVRVRGGGGRCQPAAGPAATPTTAPDPACLQRRPQLGQAGAAQPGATPAARPGAWAPAPGAGPGRERRPAGPERGRPAGPRRPGGWPAGGAGRDRPTGRRGAARSRARAGRGRPGRGWSAGRRSGRGWSTGGRPAGCRSGRAAGSAEFEEGSGKWR